MGAKDSVLTGVAGEHYVLYQLHRRGLLAALSPSNAYLADIVVFSPAMSVGSMVEVKTRTQGRDGGWHMRAKHETLVHPRLFYTFLDLEPQAPVTYVIPAAVVADVLRRSHASWLATPGVGGRAHRDHDITGEPGTRTGTRSHVGSSRTSRPWAGGWSLVASVTEDGRGRVASWTSTTGERWERARDAPRMKLPGASEPGCLSIEAPVVIDGTLVVHGECEDGRGSSVYLPLAGFRNGLGSTPSRLSSFARRHAVIARISLARARF